MLELVTLKCSAFLVQNQAPPQLPLLGLARVAQLVTILFYRARLLVSLVQWVPSAQQQLLLLVLLVIMLPTTLLMGVCLVLLTHIAVEQATQLVQIAL